MITGNLTCLARHVNNKKNTGIDSLATQCTYSTREGVSMNGLLEWNKFRAYFGGEKVTTMNKASQPPYSIPKSQTFIQPKPMSLHPSHNPLSQPHTLPPHPNSSIYTHSLHVYLLPISVPTSPPCLPVSLSLLLL